MNKEIDRRKVRLVWLAYLVITLLSLAYIMAIYFYGGMDTLKLVMTGRIPRVYLYLMITWCLAGGIIFLARSERINRENFVFWAGFFVCGFLYSVFIRQRSGHGDFPAYYRGAMNIIAGEPFHARYIYPPLWATCLQPLVRFGFEMVELFCMALNFLSFLLMYCLTHRILVRFGFCRNLAAILLTLFLCINTPVLRTFCYVQVNFHLINLLLLSVLLYPRHRFLSAVFLSIGFHLKVSPIIFCLLFLISLDWRWLFYFTIAALSIIILTSIANDFSYYHSFFENIRAKATATGFCFRSNSIDSFSKATFSLLKLDACYARVLVVTCKSALLGLSGIILFRNIKNRSFFTADKAEKLLYNGFVVLSFLMLMMSPVIWEHHMVLIIPVFLLMLKKISSPGQLFLYVLAWFLIFVVPTFDCYPFSYHRLLGLVICYVLQWQISGSKRDAPGIMEMGNKWISSLAGLSKG